AGCAPTAAAGVEPARGLLSTMNCWPRTRPMRVPRTRAVMSAAEPAMKPTMMRTGRFGYSLWAWVAPENAASVVAATHAIRIRRVMVSRLFGSAVPASTSLLQPGRLRGDRPLFHLAIDEAGEVFRRAAKRVESLRP